MIRSRCSVPDARDFKCALRMVCLSQFEGKINNSSYAHADTDHLVKYCDSLNSSVSNEDQEDQTDDNHLEISGFSYDESLISDHVKEALYNFLGSLLHKIKKNKKTCDECYNTLIIKDHEEYLGVGTFTRLREYKSNNLCYVNGQIFNYMIECEFAFRSHEELMKNEHIISQSSTIIQNSALRITYVVSILGITNTFPFVEVSFSHHYFTIIMSHTRKRSEIWNHFSESSPNKVKCLYCKDVISTTAITTDNAANIVKASKLCNWRHIPCFAHTINLAVQKSVTVEPISVIIAKVKSIVEYFKRSSSALTRLQDIQEQMNLPKIKLKQDVITRWNSTYDMLVRIFTIREAVIATLALVNRDLNVLSEEDWLEVKQAIEILHIFNEVTIEISSEKTVSVSKIPVFVHTMHRHISSEKFPDQDLKPACSSMIVVLRKELTERFDGYEDMEIIAQATLLDPRFKKFGFYSTDKYKKTLEHLRNRLKFSVSQPVNPVVFAPQSQHTVHSVSSSSNPSSLWAEFDLGVQENIRQQDPRAAVVLEIDRYIKEPLIPRTEDPLKCDISAL
ncbi:hypothetical protein GEV33_007817 [Tenebrio molitor]|uniref:BED-type domain-containing protein n=1 Tax=Tenebrio molitor TaxID=7067 RepID=A0A8J6HA66_TENMO|nr:hypothetical protein GEV33_007817 [Tenebrio molitor]